MKVKFSFKEEIKTADMGILPKYEEFIQQATQLFPVEADQIHLFVNTTQITKTTDVKTLSLYKNIIVICIPECIDITIGNVSFQHLFNLDFPGFALCDLVLDTLREYVPEVPDLDYCLLIDGREVDMEKPLREVGCRENSSVTVISRGGEDLSEVFAIDDETLAPEAEEATDAGSREEGRREKEGEAVKREKEKEAGVNVDIDVDIDINVDDIPIIESPAQIDDSLVTVSRRRGRQSTPSENVPLVDSPTAQAIENTEMEEEEEEEEEEDVKGIPKEIRMLMQVVMERFPEGSEEAEQVNILCEVIEDYNQSNARLYENYKQIKQRAYDLSLENQMLRDLYNWTGRTDLQERESTERNSYRSAASNPEKDKLTDLPDDVERLKKMVAEKYAVALLNERQYLKERERSRKYYNAVKAYDCTLPENDIRVQYFDLQQDYTALHHSYHAMKDEVQRMKQGEREWQKKVDQQEDELQHMKIVLDEKEEALAELKTRLQAAEEAARAKIVRESIGEPAKESAKEPGQRVDLTSTMRTSSVVPLPPLPPLSISMHGREKPRTSLPARTEMMESMGTIKMRENRRIRELEDEVKHLKEEMEELRREKEEVKSVEEEEKEKEEVAQTLQRVRKEREEDEKILQDMNAHLQELMQRMAARKV